MASAQAVPGVVLPGVTDPGRQQQRFPDNTTPEPNLSNQPMVRAPENEPHAPIVSGQPQASFTLTDVHIDGATAIPANQLRAAYASYLGKSVTLDDLRTIADKISAQYRNQGYILSRAIVPAGQSVAGGVVTIKVVEGYIDNVVFNGAENQNKSLLNSYADRIKAAKPLSNKVLERYLLLMDDITGATARGVLSPSDKNSGASQLTVTIDYKAIDGNVSADNRGSRFLGPVQFSGTVGANSLLHESERIQLRGITTANPHELKFIEGTYQQPVGPEGTTLRGTVSYTDTHPGASLDKLNIDGDSTAFELAARHPFIRSRQQNLFGDIGFRYRNSDTDILDKRLYDDHIRDVYLGANYDILDPLQGVNRLDFEVAQGVKIADANDIGDTDKSRSNADPTFTRMTGQYTRLQPLDRYYSFYTGVNGQYSFDPLYASEEFAVGGPAYGSAYDPAEITGDSGVAARAELRYSNSAPDADVDIYQIYGFYDVGKIWNRQAVPGENVSASLTDTGIGTRITFLEAWALNGEVAFPLTRRVAAQGTDGSDQTRFFFSLSYLF